MATSLDVAAIAVDNYYYNSQSDTYPDAATAQASMVSNLAHEAAHAVYADHANETDAQACVECLTSSGPVGTVDECDEAFAYKQEADFACEKANEVNAQGQFVLLESDRAEMIKQADGACEKCATFTQQCQEAANSCPTQCPGGAPSPCGSPRDAIANRAS